MKFLINDMNVDMHEIDFGPVVERKPVMTNNGSIITRKIKMNVKPSSILDQFLNKNMTNLMIFTIDENTYSVSLHEKDNNSYTYDVVN